MKNSWRYFFFFEYCNHRNKMKRMKENSWLSNGYLFIPLIRIEKIAFFWLCYFFFFNFKAGLIFKKIKYIYFFILIKLQIYIDKFN